MKLKFKKLMNVIMKYSRWIMQDKILMTEPYLFAVWCTVSVCAAAVFRCVQF